MQFKFNSGAKVRTVKVLTYSGYNDKKASTATMVGSMSIVETDDDYLVPDEKLFLNLRLVKTGSAEKYAPKISDAKIVSDIFKEINQIEKTPEEIEHEQRWAAEMAYNKEVIDLYEWISERRLLTPEEIERYLEHATEEHKALSDAKVIAFVSPNLVRASAIIARGRYKPTQKWFHDVRVAVQSLKHALKLVGEFEK